MGMDMLGILKEQLEKTGKVVANVTADQFANSTPCENFDARALINHLCVGNHFMATLAEGGSGAPQADKDFVGADHAAAYEASRQAAVASFDRPGILEQTFHFPFGDMPGMQAAGLGILETVVHRWDLATATGQDPDIDPMVATMMLEGAKMSMAPEFRSENGDPFGHPVEVPDDASPVDKLAAFMGRKP
jgi:uncharacterized protein (TIGR03086 family)